MVGDLLILDPADDHYASRVRLLAIQVIVDFCLEVGGLKWHVLINMEERATKEVESDGWLAWDGLAGHQTPVVAAHCCNIIIMR